MRTIFLICLLALAGCAGNKPLPPPVAVIHTSGEAVTLEDICFSLERYAVHAGLESIGEPSQETYIEIHPMLQGEVTTLVHTINSLPIENFEDVDAVARLIYKNCILKHER